MFLTIEGSKLYAVKAAALCPKASTTKTPGITGCPGKCPLKKNLFFVIFIIPVAEIMGTILVNLSINKKGSL